MIGGIRVYDMEAFKLAFAFLLVWVLIAFIALLLTRESNCRQFQE
jgi:hypothetical protein